MTSNYSNIFLKKRFQFHVPMHIVNISIIKFLLDQIELKSMNKRNNFLYMQVIYVLIQTNLTLDTNQRKRQ